MSELRQHDVFYATINGRELEGFPMKPCMRAAIGTRHKWRAMWFITEDDVKYNGANVHNIDSLACELLDEEPFQDDEWTVSWVSDRDLDDIEIIVDDIEIIDRLTPATGEEQTSRSSNPDSPFGI